MFNITLPKTKKELFIEDSILLTQTKIPKNKLKFSQIFSIIKSKETK